jgi:hypothetical protein
MFSGQDKMLAIFGVVPKVDIELPSNIGTQA